MAPRLSIILISYNIPRELPRTLYSLSATFQQGIERDEYEVLVVDNGSKRPPDPADYADIDADLRFHRMDPPHPSPVAAINYGASLARGQWLCIYIDGARLASPGLLATAMEALHFSPRAVVGSRGRYLGPDMQSAAIRSGYSREREDALLESIDWRNDGYRLFDISVFDESSLPTWFNPIFESNSLFLSRAMWDELGGYDPIFERAGGGMVNLDSWRRAISLPGAIPIVLLGEATFHQLHGGSSTNHPEPMLRGMVLAEEYRSLRGIPFSVPQTPLRFWGTFRRPPLRRELIGGVWSPLVWRINYEYFRYRIKLWYWRLTGKQSADIAVLPPPW